MYAEFAAIRSSVFLKRGDQLGSGHLLQSLDLNTNTTLTGLQVTPGIGGDETKAEVTAAVGSLCVCWSHLSVEPVKHILLCQDLSPVPVHLLPEVCVLTLLQLH